MEKSAKRKFHIVFWILPLLCGALLFCSFFSFQEQPASGELGTYTFERELSLPSSKTVKFYESGDQYYHYYHDSDGFILVKKEGELYYAQNENGRPRASSVRYPAGKLAVNNVEKMTYGDVDFEENPDLLTEYPVEEDTVPDAVLKNAPAQGNRTIANIIIYIVFKDDTINLTGNPAANMLGGSAPSLSDYFYKASDGGLTVTNFFPMNGTLVHVYRAPENREYYNVESTNTRGKREAVLLTAAVNSVSQYISTGSADIDTNDDGYVDSVGFLIGGSSSSTWGSLLWPHSWNLASINKSYNNSAHARIAGVEVGNYSFNFTTSITLGVLCHEFFHVLGAPDLYHYSYDFVPVGDWDIMQFNKDVPQLMLSYMRTAYLGVSADRVGTISSNGVYSLKPTVSAGTGDYFAYKIPTGVYGQYFMVEYRNNTVSSTYDSMLPASGLVVYRIKEGVEDGNRNAKYQSTSSPDEVYVFRPRVASTGKETSDDTRYANSKTDIAYAALSPDNNYFKSLGATLENKPSATYDYSTIFYVNGKNSGIVIETLSMSEGRIEFRVQLSSDNTIADDYFNDKFSIQSAQSVNSGYAGISAYLAAGEIDLSYLRDVSVKLKNATGTVLAENTLNLGKFRAAYESGERIFECPFIINDKGIPVDSVFRAGEIDTGTAPYLVQLLVTDADNDTKIIATSQISFGAIDWDSVLATRTELNAGICAASRITLGVRKDGRVETSGLSQTGGLWAADGTTGIISASAGLTHLLLLDTQRKVIAFGTNDNGESNVSNWSDIKIVEAGYRTSYGVDIQGKMYAVGDNHYGQTNVSGWTGIVSVSAGVRHVAAVDKYGKVYSAGSDTNGQRDLSGITNAKAVACGSTFTACLLNDGTVAVVGDFAGADAVSGWTDIVELSAGENFLIGLKSDRTVVAAGINDAGQCDVEGIADIIGIAAGEYHAAFLREDGTVLFTGSQNGSYEVKSGIGNLIYDNYIDVTNLDFSLTRTTIYTGVDNDYAGALCRATVYPANATYKKLIYRSSDPSVATVTANGSVRAVGAGTAYITATVNGSAVSKSVEITVQPFIDVTSIRFSDDESTLVVNRSLPLMLVLSPSNATLIGSVSYRVLTPDLGAFVNAYGVVTAGNAFGTVTVEAVLTQNGISHRTTCRINIKSAVKKIEIISMPTKTVYKCNEEFSVEGGRIRITNEDDSISDQSVTPAMISGYDKTLCTQQIITISYLDATATFPIVVENYVESVALVEPVAKTEYKYGESLDFSGLKINKKWANGDVTLSSLPLTAVAEGYNKHTVGIQIVSVAFTLDGKEYRVTYSVTVLDIVLVLSGEAIVKTVYLYGEALSPSENVLLYMASGAQRTVPLSQTECEGYNPNLCGIQKVSVSYYDEVNGQSHSFEMQVTVELRGEAQVYTVDDQGGRHRYYSPDSVYYTVGGSLPIEVVFALADGRQIQIGKDPTQNISYSLQNFSPSNSGASSALVKIDYKKNRLAAGGAIVPDTDSIYLLLYVYGEAELEKIYPEGDKEYEYGETPVFTVYTVDIYGKPGGGAPDYIYYDAELVDEPQTCSIYYKNRVLYETIIIHDYALELIALPDRNVPFGTSVDFEVYAVLAKGNTRLLAKNSYTVEGLDTRTLGTRTVTVRYGELFTTFSLTVYDVLTDVTLLSRIPEKCRYGQALDTSSQYRYIMASGAVVAKNFDTSEFSVLNFNNRILGTQNVKIVHIATGKEFVFKVEVVNWVVSLVLSEGDPTLYQYGEELGFSMKATYANGTFEFVELSVCEVSGYSPRVIGAQTVRVTYKEASAEIKVTVLDTVSLIVFTAEPTKKTYGYGEAFDPTGGKLRVEFKSGKAPETISGARIGEAASTYNPLAVGAQTVTFTLGAATATLQVRVNAKQANTFALNTSGGKLIQNDKSIVYYETMTAAQLAAALTCADYLTAQIKSAGGAYTKLHSMGDAVLRSDDVLQVVNTAGFVVFSYQLYLKGDADCDGMLTASDIGALAAKLVSANYDKAMTDYDGDGFFTLTDLVGWARKCSDKELPLNNMARAFVSDGRRKEELL